MKKYIFISLVLTSLVVLPAVSQASMISSLQTLAAKLQGQLSSLQSAAVGLVGGNNSCFNLGHNLSLNNGNQKDGLMPDIKKLQKFLTSHDSPVSTTGFFGAKTKTAIMHYQRAVDLPTTGRLDEATRNFIKQQTCGTATVAPITPATSLPAGCTSTTGFSPITGKSCSTVVTPTPIPVTPTPAPAPVVGSIVYSIQDCYNACNGLVGVQAEGFCRNSMSTESCDSYGKPSLQLDLFVNRTKNMVAIQTKNAIIQQQELINQQNYVPPICDVWDPNVPGSGSKPLVKGCVLAH